MLQTKSLRTTILMTLAVASLLAYNFIGATSAPASPPNNNTPAPINVGPDYQPKSGSLGVVTMRSGGYCNAGGTSCIWTDGGANNFFVSFGDYDEMDAGIQVNNNSFNFVADRNNDGIFSGDWRGAWPLQLQMNPDVSQEFARFSNQVRANEYCDINGQNCLGPDDFLCPPDHALNAITTSGEVVCIYVTPAPVITYSWYTSAPICTGSPRACEEVTGASIRTVYCISSEGQRVDDSFCSTAGTKPSTNVGSCTIKPYLSYHSGGCNSSNRPN